MTTSTVRAWRFVHPDLDLDSGDVPARGPGLVVSRTGGIAMASDDAAVRQSLVLLLSTMPGERVMRPDYGCPLHRLLFAPNDDSTAGLAIHYVCRAVERWEPRVDILAVDAGPDPEEAHRLEVTLDYRVRSTRRVDRLALDVELFGGMR